LTSRLAAGVARAVADAGYTIPTPIQSQAIPTMLPRGPRRHGRRQTGTGGTAGFALPILQKLLPMANASPSPARHPVRALILNANARACDQVEEAVKTYGKYTGIRSTVVYGGVDIRQQLPIVPPASRYWLPLPGACWTTSSKKSVNLSQVEIFVLDEADRMLDMVLSRTSSGSLALLPPPPSARTCSFRRLSRTRSKLA
jgi:superfamily II DNA/RNA helicase